MLFSAAFVVTCAADHGDTSAWHAERDTVGDTVVVRTVSGSVWGAPRALVATATVGKADGEDHDLPGDCRALAVGPDGSIYISDEGPVLYKYAPDGHYVATLSRKGGGPGEYARPDGRHLGQVTTPDGFQRYPEPVFRGDTVWAGFQDADGVLHVRRCQVSARSDGGGA